MNKNNTTILLVCFLSVILTGVFTFRYVAGVNSGADFNMQYNRITSLSHPPVQDNDATTKRYIDDSINNLSPDIDGGGTSGYVARWSDSNTLTNSVIQDDGSYVGINKSPLSVYQLDVSGYVRADRYYGDGSSLSGIEQSLWSDKGSYIQSYRWVPPGYEGVTIITDYGRMGIKTTSPSRKLEVAGEVAIFGNSSFYAHDSTGIGLKDSSGNVGIWVESGGKVGVGTTNPSYDLDVNGEMNSYGYYMTGSSSFDPELPAQWNKSGSTIYYDRDSWPWSGQVAIGKSYAYSTLDVGGSLAVSGTKNFVIDHPLKPDKMLVHASVEGPEAAVFYRGEGQLIDGKATIELPDYFEALTIKESRTILVTPKFDSEEELVSRLSVYPIKNNTFTVISTDNNNPNQKFYWEVKAVRADIPALEIEPGNLEQQDE